MDKSFKLPGGMTVEFFEQFIFKQLGDVKIKKILSSAGSTHGDNHLSEISRIKVIYVKSGREESKTFIVKDVGQSKASTFVKAVCGIEKENSWYEEIYPEVLKFGIEVGATGFKSKGEWLLLEDLGARGYSVVERKNLLDLNHCVSAVKALAKFHAVTHHLHNLNKLPEIAKIDTQFISGHDKLIYQNFKDFDEIIHTLTTLGNTKFNEAIKGLESNLWHKMKRVLDKDYKFLCLVHGDYWTSNILFKYEKNKISDAKIIDFQLIRLSVPSYDLNFFICTSMPPQVRDKHLDQILAVYLETLNTTLKAVGSKSFLTGDEFHNMMTETSLVGLFIALTFLPIPLCDTPIEFEPPEDMPLQQKQTYSRFSQVYKQKNYQEHFQSLLEYFRKQSLL